MYPNGEMVKTQRPLEQGDDESETKSYFFELDK